MKRDDDMIGRRFGKLTVVEHIKPRPSSWNNWGRTPRGKRWRALCDCGRTVTGSTWWLVHRMRSCGCQKQKLDLTKKRFGQLTALRPTEERTADGCVMWTCRCDCGNYVKAKTHHLRQGSVKSCGCLQTRYA